MSKKRLLSRAEVDVNVWSERDRLHIAIVDKKTGQRTIAEWWDDDARQMFEDGFFKRGVELKRSVINYAEEMGLLSKIGRNPDVRPNPSGAPNMVWGMYVLIALNRIYKVRLAPNKISALPGWISIQTGTRLVIDALRKKFGPMDYHDPRVQTVIEMAKSMELVKSNPGGPVRKNIFTFNNPGNAQRVLAENFVRGANSGVASSMYIHGNRIYSYGPHFPIAERHTISTTPLAGTPVIIITNRKSPSRTTSSQIGLVKAAAQAAGMEMMYEELKPEAKGPAAYSNPGTRKNIFTFNNPRAIFNPRELNTVERAAAAVGLVVGTWAPGDGVTRYRFFLSDGKSSYGDYHQGDGLYTALGRKDAMAFISAYGKGRSARQNPKSSGVYVIEGFTHQGRRGQSKRYGEFRTPSFAAARAKAEQIFQETGSVVAITQKNPLTHRETSSVVGSARFHARMARSITPGSPYRSHLLGVAEGQLNVASQYGRGKNRGRAGTMVSAIDRMAMARGGPFMRFSHKPVRRNPVCSNPIIRGDKLPYNLQQEVLRRFIYRWTTGNTQREAVYRRIEKPRIPLISDQQWLREHAFHVTKAGKLDARHAHAEPHYMADDWKKGDPLPNPLLQTVMMANPPISQQWDRMTPRQRLQLLSFVGYPDNFAASYAQFPWVTLNASAKRALERQWNDTGGGQRAGTTTRRRRLASVDVANPLTRTESGQIIRDARFDVRHGSSFVPGHTRSERAGQAWAKAKVVRQYGPKSARRAANRISDKARTMARTTISNPGTLRLPKPGTRLTVAQALDLAQRIGDRSLIAQCQQALKLQKAANKNSKCVIWKTFAMGSKDKIDSVVALTHYGDSPETMYKPPKGSRKGQHMYRHKWGEGGGGKKTVPLLASADGKMLLMPLEGRKVASDWLRH